MFDSSKIPVRGKLTPDYALSKVTWLRVGGPADWLFQPADVEDLASFLSELPKDVPIFPMGVGSNLIVRDGGIRGVVLRLGRPFSDIAIAEGKIRAGSAAIDARVATAAADAGLDLTFLRTIPGSIGGAVRMNAGCYGTYVADRLVEIDVMHRDGRLETLPAGALDLKYRSSVLPADAVILSAVFEAPVGDPEALHAKMKEQLAKRDATQPTKARTAGSTFRNPAGFSSTGRADDSHELKAWKVIENAGMRGARRGGAQMSEMHSNFLLNTGDATAADLEGLGEEVRARVRETQGLELTWEVIRIGDPAP